MDDASTRDSVLLTPPPGVDRKWLYYREPVQRYLRGLGCAEQDIEDLTHEILIRLHTYVVAGYDRSRPFRPYFKSAIRNLYYDHLRRHRPTEAIDHVEKASDDGECAPDLTPVAAYARSVYEQFAKEVTGELAKDAALLREWLVDGTTQEELAERRGQTGRYMRKRLGRAADALAAWMQERINDDDLLDLADLARQHRIDCDLRGDGLRDLFRHLSHAKRMRVLAVLAYVHRRPGEPATGGPQ